MSADDRKRHGYVAGDKVVVRVAQAGRGQLDHDLVGSGWVKRDFFDLPLLAHAPQHRGFGPHLTIPHVVGRRKRRGDPSPSPTRMTRSPIVVTLRVCSASPQRGVFPALNGTASRTHPSSPLPRPTEIPI